MSEITERLAQYPDISFIEGVTLDGVQAKMMQDFADKYYELTGTVMTLGKADPIRLILYAAAVQIYQGYERLDFAGKMGFLKYSYGEYLDNLGALKGVIRNEAASAVCTVRFTLSAVRASVTSIPQGTRLTTSNANVYFTTDNYAEIPAGDLYIDIPCTCSVTGDAGNGLTGGEISVLVDPVPYIANVANLAETSGGMDRETDDALAERIYLSPANYSVAGPEAAYEYFTRLAYAGVGDVKVSSPDECEVDIRVIGADGSLLSEDVLQMIEDYINQKEVKPMTDHVTVSSPTASTYNINFTYYIHKNDALQATAIQGKVDAAVNEYVKWQAGKIGRDIEPSKLTEMVMAAGAKRVDITYPVHTAIDATTVPVLGTKTVTYGGLEE